MEKIIKESHKENLHETILAERIDDQQLLYSKLEDKFRAIIKEREIIESAIGGIVEFESICESKLD